MDYAIFKKIDHEVYHIKFSPNLPNNADFEKYLNALTSLVYNNKGIYMVFDSSYAPYIPLELRKQQANWMKQHEKQILKSIHCAVYVIPDSIQRSILNSIYQIQKPVSPYKIVESYKNAITYLLHIKMNKIIA